MRRRPRTYFLHVLPTGEEEIYRREPDRYAIPTVKVTVEGGVERTLTRNRRTTEDGDFVPVPPPGADWQQEEVGDSSTSWTRSAR